MHVIICGAGQVGYNIAQQLSKEGNEVTIIDNNSELIRKINDTLEVRALVGFASHPRVLAKAGMDKADMIIAVTYSDEVNMIACQVAHSIFNVPTKIARVRHQDYLKAEWKPMYSRDHMPIDYIISPEQEVANAILRRLEVPGAVDMFPFAEDKLRVLAIRCDAECPMNNLPLHIVNSKLDDIELSILGIIQDNNFHIHKDNIMVREDNIIYVACETKYMNKALKAFGHEEKEARKIIILGGGNVGYYVAEALEKNDELNARVKVIEQNKERAEKIAHRLEDTTIVHGSGLDKEILTECGIESTETIICVTNDDKVNILSALLAKRYGCERAVSLVNNNTYIPLLGKLGVDAIINPRESTVSSILQHIRRGKIRSVHSIHDGAAEIIEAEAVATSPLIGKAIGDIDWPNGTLVGAILRDDEVIISDNETVIAENDRIIIVSDAKSVKKVEKLFTVSLEFF